MAKRQQIEIELEIEIVDAPLNERQENNFVMAWADALEKQAMEMIQEGAGKKTTAGTVEQYNSITA